MPHSIALAATGLDPENGLGVVKAWVESGGDVNGCWDAEDHGGQLNVHRFLRDPEMRGDPLLLMVVYGTTLNYRNEEAVERDCRDRLELIRFLLSRGADPNSATVDGTTALHILVDDSRSAYRLTVARLLIDAGANLEAPSEYFHGMTPLARVLDHWNVAQPSDLFTLLLSRGASLDFPTVQEDRGVTRNSAEAMVQSKLDWLTSPDCGLRQDARPGSIAMVKETLRLVTAIRAAGSWKRYVRTPHIKLVVLRSLLARGRARRRPLWAQPTPHALVRLFDPSLPNGVFWHVLSYWRETG